ncbi:hypothetical protein GQ53DRAFT_817238 [Thozetella sp. PMI_491]|nr:hypothetical protein GQ53DRAFT_817238 [Thozetella sp. PMI_491]
MSYTVAGKETHIDFTEATINEDSSSHDTHTMTDDRNHPDGSNSPPIRGCISPLESFRLAILHRGTPSASIAPSSQATESSGSPWDSEMLSISDSPPEFNSAKGSNMNLLMSILRILIVEFYATKRGNNAPTTPQAPITSSTTGSSTSNDSSSLASKKRPSGSDEDSNGSSEDKLAPSSKKRPRLTDARKRFLACPFWKRHRDSHFRCSKLALNRIRDVKQHLNRRHYQEFHCPRCFTIFEEEQALDSHIRGQIVCQPSSGRLDGMSHHQHRALCKKSKPNQSAEEQWFVIWDILFLGHERPESAYVDPEFSEDFHEFQRFTQRRGPELLENLLNMNGVWSMPERDRQLQLRGILAQGFDAIREDWMTTPSPGPSYSALSTQPVENSHHGSNPALAVPSPSISMVDDRAGSQSEKNTDGLDGERQLPRLVSQGIQTVTESLAALDVLPEQELYRCLVNDLDPNFIDNEVSSAELNSEVQLGSRASMPGFIYDQTFLEAGLETVFNQYIENSVGVCMD